ncbi:MAG: tetratricopeptide repeat protein [Bryobacteraceae bacterium]
MVHRAHAGLMLAMGIFSGIAAGAAQHGHEENLGRPAVLLPGMGSHHHRISTTNPEAQKFFDQGLILAFAFNHDEAARSFRRAIELAPQAAMPYWGLAWVLGPRYALAALTPGSETFLDVDLAREKAAFKAVQNAVRISSHAPENERRYIEALAKRYSANRSASRRKLLTEYKEAMGQLTRRYPDDLDAAVLYAESIMSLRPWQLWKQDGTPEEGTMEAASVLEAVLSHDPQHPGANHYYIHVLEGSRNPERALPSAERLMTLVPGAGHLLHMPAHIYFQTGDYEPLAITNEHAAAVDKDYIERTGASGVYPLMFYPHNIQFVAVARAAQGQYQEAKAAADRLAAVVTPTVHQMQMAEAWIASPLFVQLRFQRWDDILAMPAPDSALVTVNALWHFARSIAFAAKGKAAQARGERDLFQAARKQVPENALYVNGNNSVENVLKVAASVLEARLATDRRSAIELWKKAVEAQDALIYDEPPPWYYPVRESWGAALLGNGQAAEAEAVFREDLKRNKRNGRSLFGLMESLKFQDKTSDAEWVRKEFETAWKGGPLRIEDL